eukprot:2199766-Pyramimonas_sp.AAC.1
MHVRGAPTLRTIWSAYALSRFSHLLVSHSAILHWECPDCREEKGRDHPASARKFSKCRFADSHVPPRPRTGQHRRSPARPGGPRKTGEQQAQLTEGVDLGAAGQAAQPAALSSAPEASASSSAGAH